MSRTHLPEAEHHGFTVLHVSKVALLTTFRRNGQGVGTPVGIRLAEGKAYFTKMRRKAPAFMRGDG